MAQKVEVEDFSGGITDYYLSAPPNKVKQCDNLLINQYQDQGKVFTRPGSRLYDALWPNISTANRINTCFFYQNILYVQAASKLFYYDKNVGVGVDRWKVIPGRSGHDAFPSATGNSQFTYAHWNYHTLIADTGYGYPMKVTYNDGVATLVQAGLPKPNSSEVSKEYPTVTTGGKNYLYRIVYRRDYSAGPTGGTSFLDVSSPSLPIEVLNYGQSSDPTVAIGSPEGPIQGVANYFALPAVGDPNITYWVNSNDSYYLWDTTTSAYIEITDTDLDIALERVRFSVKLTNLPTITNDSNTNWDVNGTKRDIYRTLNNGTVYYYVGTIENNTDTSFEDTLTDSIRPILSYDQKSSFPATGNSTNLYFSRQTGRYYVWIAAINYYIRWDNKSLDANQQLYTTGGVVDNDAPPQCKTIHVRNDIAYYGNCVQGQEVNYYRMLQSVPGDIDSVPETFYVDVDDEIVAVSSTKNNVIILCKQKIYRVDGFFDELGRGGMTVERISDTAGCISTQCPVQALDGVLWLGKDAVYYTDGFKVLKLNQDFDRTYRTFTASDTNNLKFQGKYDKFKNRVWWTIQEPNTSDLNKCYVLDLNWGIRENATFTTVSGQSFVPTAIEFLNGDLVRCNQFGHVLIHQDGIYVDPKIDSTIAPSEWVNETILYTLETCSYNFGSSATRKYVTQANITCESNTNVALQIVSNNDDNRIVANLLPIRYRGNIIWGEPDVYWRDGTLEWNKQGLIHEKRLMPAKSLRCNYKSLKFENAKIAILSSDVIGTATINRVAKTVTLTNIVNYDWPTKAIGYFIAFEADGYTREYEIIGRTDDVLIYADPLNTSQSATNQKWVIRGKPQGETLNLLNFSIIFDVAGPSLNPYRTSSSGEVNA